MPRLYSLKEIRQLLREQGVPVPDGTLRNYRDTFLEFLPYEGKGRFARYHEDSLEIFKKIRLYRSEDCLDNASIRRKLAEEFGILNPEHEPFEHVQEAGPAPDSPMNTPATGPVDAVMVQARGDEMARFLKNIETRTRILIDDNAKILYILKEKNRTDDRKLDLLKQEINTMIDQIRSEQELLRRQLEKLQNGDSGVEKEPSRPPLSSVSQTRDMEPTPAGDYGEDVFSQTKQRTFFDKLMKF